MIVLLLERDLWTREPTVKNIIAIAKPKRIEKQTSILFEKRKPNQLLLSSHSLVREARDKEKERNLTSTGPNRRQEQERAKTKNPRIIPRIVMIIREISGFRVEDVFIQGSKSSGEDRASIKLESQYSSLRNLAVI